MAGFQLTLHGRIWVTPEAFAEEWKPHAILVEDRASGQSLVQELKHSTALPIIPVKVDTDKIATAQAVTPLMEAGKVFLPESAAWLNDFVDEMAAFRSEASLNRELRVGSQRGGRYVGDDYAA
jgi:predicted phage terminase large subunit-like protein